VNERPWATELFRAPRIRKPEIFGILTEEASQAKLFIHSIKRPSVPDIQARSSNPLSGIDHTWQKGCKSAPFSTVTYDEGDQLKSTLTKRYMT
jgi:hypothetical protein